MNELTPSDVLFRAAASEDGTKVIYKCAHSNLDLNMTDSVSGITPLYRAVVLDRRRNVAMLLDQGADPNFRFTFSSRVDHRHIEPDRTALFYAKSADIAEMLVDAGANPNAADADGVTVLANAIVRGRVDVVRYLLTRRVDVSSLARSKKGGPQQSALDIARQQRELWLSMKDEIDQVALAQKLAIFDEIIHLLLQTDSA